VGRLNHSGKARFPGAKRPRPQDRVDSSTPSGKQAAAGSSVASRIGIEVMKAKNVQPDALLADAKRI
jgi:hypothetical protein